ncbi:unnamed protein product [Triticum turgidum subsp. durum]|uniref:Calmodulin-lysine N-methyltransferase n=1 Tax=Triticum turgidum subsp. durum TaxID=4567 RepID=A0A9R0VVG1_TRITD|nr:unnamed protein product [Triticum turgidum subsp. durum]
MYFYAYGQYAHSLSFDISSTEKGDTNKISRKTSRSFNLFECHTVPISQLNKSQGDSLNGNENGVECQRDVYVCYKLPCGGSPELNVIYRRDDSLELNDIEASNRFNIDTTGLVFIGLVVITYCLPIEEFSIFCLECCWPSEEVLAFYCINHSDMFRFTLRASAIFLRLFSFQIHYRSKRVLELGAGYGLAGLVIAASVNAGEVVISDGNPQVVGCILLNELYIKAVA